MAKFEIIFIGAREIKKKISELKLQIQKEDERTFVIRIIYQSIKKTKGLNCLR